MALIIQGSSKILLSDSRVKRILTVYIRLTPLTFNVLFRQVAYLKPFLYAGDFIYYKVLKDKILIPRYLFAGCCAARQGGELRFSPFGIPHRSYFSSFLQDFII